MMTFTAVSVLLLLQGYAIDGTGLAGVVHTRVEEVQLPAGVAPSRPVGAERGDVARLEILAGLLLLLGSYACLRLLRAADAEDPGRVTGYRPVATTDYIMNAAADGSGADLTANFTVLATYGTDSVDYEIKNNGVTQGYIR